jgi:Ca-activated chloride channel family protein
MSQRTSSFLLLSALVLGANACSMMVQVPTTPRMQNLTEAQVFSMAPPPEWPVPQPDNPAVAPVEISCGIGPLPTNGYLYAAVAVRGRPPTGTLAPLNIALVLDRSGSMSGKPFENMIGAAETFVRQLRDGDRVSVVAFSDGVYEGVPPVVIDPTTRVAALAAIHSLGSGGGTNFSGGLLAGLFEVFSAFQFWQVNQVVLFSDGQPNIGITSASELARIAERAADHGVSITTIGFGDGHDELLMQGIADASGGYYYYVDKPEDFQRIFEREAGAILRSAARGSNVAFTIPPGLQVEDVLGYDYIMVGGNLWVRLGSIPHGEERYVVLKLRVGASGQLPLQVAYSDLARRGRFGTSCSPRFDAKRGGTDNWALELAGRAEAAWGLSEAMAWADEGSEVFVISQIGHTRGVIAGMRDVLGQQSLSEEDNMLLRAQVELGLGVAEKAKTSLLSGGVSGLMSFGANQAVSNATTAVVYNVDKSFRVRIRPTVAVTFQGQAGTRHVAHGTTYKPRSGDASLRFKRARFRSYEMMRVRPGR